MSMKPGNFCKTERKLVTRKVEARTFTAADESNFWDWLGDAYISSEDFGDGESTWTSIFIKTPNGETRVEDGDVITKDANSVFRHFTNEQFEKEHASHICLLPEESK